MLQLARAILLARDDLPADLQALLTPSVAWTLAVLLVSWRPQGLGGEVNISSYGDVTSALDRFADTLLRFRQSALAAKDDVDLSGAAGIFVSAVNRIGPSILAYILRSDRVQALQSYILSVRPMPSALGGPSAKTAQSDRPTRAERFAQFDNRPRNATSKPLASDLPQVAHWRSQLAREDLKPEMRWFYEQKLSANDQPLYTDAADAQRRWTGVLAQSQLNPELREYFRANLSNLERMQRQA